MSEVTFEFDTEIQEIKIKVVTTFTSEEEKLNIGFITNACTDDELNEFKRSVDSVVIVPEDNAGWIGTGIQAITELVSTTGLVSLDFADVMAIMTEQGLGYIGTGLASGEDSVVRAAEKAIKNQLLETSIAGAKGAIINITSGANLKLSELDKAIQVITDAIDLDANTFYGAVVDETMGDKVRVTVIATGI